MGVGHIDKTCYFIIPDDGEHSSFLLTRQHQCISGVIPVAGAGHGIDVLWQLTKGMALQNEESAMANQLRHDELSWKKENGEIKDRTTNCSKTNTTHRQSGSSFKR